MIINFKMNGISTRKDEILGKFEKGGFASKVNYIDHLIDLKNINGKSMVYLGSWNNEDDHSGRIRISDYSDNNNSPLHDYSLTSKVFVVL